ncbi:MAG: nicotinate (nicotinamide) nucleotide adenylyltransferase [bacterium]
MKIGIFGGSFDPFHKGHLHVLVESCKSILFDRLILLPNYQSPHKHNSHLSAKQRYTLLHTLLPYLTKHCEKATQKKIPIILSDIEITKQSWTINSLKILHKQYPKDHLYLLMGSDCFFSFHTWKDYQEIPHYCDLVITQRDKKSENSYEDYANDILEIKKTQWRLCKNNINPISAHSIKKYPSKIDTAIPAPIKDQLKQNIKTPTEQKQLIIGITGRVGSGKSYALKIIEKELSAKSIELDIIGHRCLEKTSPLLIKQFGKDILTNDRIDRNKLRKIVFSHAKNLQILNTLIHPKIKAKTLQEISQNKNKFILICGALLHEINLNIHCDIIINIDAHASKIKQHIGSKFKAASFQLSKKTFKQKATYTLTNTFSKTFTIACINLCTTIKKKSTDSLPRKNQ